MSRTTTKGSPLAYLALLADVRGSRDLPDRAAAQRRLVAAVAEANQRFGRRLASPIALTGGDELKALAVDVDTVRGLVDGLTRLVDPLSLRFGVGRGTLSTPLDLGGVGTLDGPCFHRARAAIDNARQQDVRLAFAGFGRAEPTTILHVSLALASRVRDRWTETQTRYIHMLGVGQSQKDVAEAAGVSPSTVSEALKAALYHDVWSVESTAFSNLSFLHQTLPPDAPEA